MRLAREEFQRRLVKRRRFDRIFHLLIIGASFLGVAVLAVLLMSVIQKGLPWLSSNFFNGFTSHFPEKAGIKAALAGSVWVAALTALFTFPLGVATAVFLEEYAPKNSFMHLIDLNIANLAGVPSIVYGILGLAVFVNWLALGRSILAGALTMTLMSLPVVITSSREAIKSVPVSLRHASFGLGATRWQTVRRVVLPAALPGIMTGTILSMSRAVGETAPLLVVGVLSFVHATPSGPLDSFTVLPIQIYDWTRLPQEDYKGLAAAAILVLMVALLSVNAVAVWLRSRSEKRARY